MMGTRHALTTVDNPFNPIDDFKQWLEWDRRAGYDTYNYLGRIAILTDELPDHLEDQAVSDAIDEILDEHGPGFFVKVSQTYPDPVYAKVVEPIGVED